MSTDPDVLYRDLIEALGCATNFGPAGRRPHLHQLDGGGVCIVDACMFGLDDVED